MHQHITGKFSLKPVSLILILSSVFLLVSNAVRGEVMSSGNFKIQSDSVNFGGLNSSSNSYTLEDTLGEQATGESESNIYTMKAGYQQMQETYLSVTPADDVVMSPSIGGVSGGTANGSTAFTVVTDNAAGYSVSIKASSSPALVSTADSFTDYSPSGSNPDFSFTVSNTGSVFALSPEGSDIAQRFKDNGSACNDGSGDTADKCWDGLSTASKTIIQRNSSNQPTGTETVLKFRAASGSDHIQTNGSYVATTTITVITL